MSIRYTYLSDGTKWSIRTAFEEGAGHTFYRGNFIYGACEEPGDDNVVNFELERIATPDGCITETIDGPLDLWYVKDHLGNVRGVVDISGVSEILETDDYAPFGVKIPNPEQSTLYYNRWRYAGKEEQATLLCGNSQLIDFGARYYDPWSTRWTTTDPIAEKYLGMSPYGYCSVNPINRVDLTGADDYEFDERGNFKRYKTVDPYDRVLMSNGNSMVVKDKAILSNMETKKYQVQNMEGEILERYLSYSTTESDSSEIIAVFAFLQENSSVEWGVYHGESGRSLLGTTQDSDGVRTDMLLHYDKCADYENKVDPYDSKIHGHPGVDASHVTSSMEADILNVRDNPHIRSYVYFPIEKQIYKATLSGPKKVPSYKNWSPK